MARIPRLLLHGETATYHVISRTALPGFPLGEVEKDYLLGLIHKLSQVYFAELLGFCLMGSHLHLVVRMHTGETVSDDEVRERFRRYYGPDSKRELAGGQIPSLREKWASLSEFVRDIKQSFSRWFNKRHDRRGFFWGERFKSVLVEDGDTLIQLLAYVDLNPVRAGLVERPEHYRWSGLGHHAQTGNADGLLSLDFGLRSFTDADDPERFRRYRRYVYEVGSIPSERGAAIDEKAYQAEARKDFRLTGMDRFLLRSRHFTDSGVIGSKAFVAHCSQRFHDHFRCKHEKKPQPVSGLEGVYALKRLRLGV